MTDAICSRHAAERNRPVICAECDFERIQAAQDKRTEERKRELLRDRMAVQFAVVMLSDLKHDTAYASIACEAYRMADAMVAERDGAWKPKRKRQSQCPSVSPRAARQHYGGDKP